MEQSGINVFTRSLSVTHHVEDSHVFGPNTVPPPPVIMTPHTAATLFLTRWFTHLLYFQKNFDDPNVRFPSMTFSLLESLQWSLCQKRESNWTRELFLSYTNFVRVSRIRSTSTRMSMTPMSDFSPAMTFYTLGITTNGHYRLKETVPSDMRTLPFLHAFSACAK